MYVFYFYLNVFFLSTIYNLTIIFNSEFTTIYLIIYSINKQNINIYKRERQRTYDVGSLQNMKNNNMLATCQYIETYIRWDRPTVEKKRNLRRYIET